MLLQNLHYSDNGTAFVLIQLKKELQQLSASIGLMYVGFFPKKYIYELNSFCIETMNNMQLLEQLFNTVKIECSTWEKNPYERNKPI